MTCTTSSVLSQLIAMSLDLGRPERDLVLLGEGNTSALVEGDRFWVKASGSSLVTIDQSGFVLLDRRAAAALLDADLPTDDAVQTALAGVTLENAARRPSVEAMMHAYLLGLPGIGFVGHTHPVTVNALLCSVRAEELVNLRLFPDQIVCCGPQPVYVPYTDPGLPLARAVRERVNAWIEKHGMLPKAIVLQNHGLFALGRTPNEVMSCTLMWEKTARIILGAMACGGAHVLEPAQVERIFTRPDEKYREKIIGR